MIRNCIECGDEYDDRSPEKKRAGGLVVTCPDCSCAVMSFDEKEKLQKSIKGDSHEDENVRQLAK